MIPYHSDSADGSGRGAPQSDEIWDQLEKFGFLYLKECDSVIPNEVVKQMFACSSVSPSLSCFLQLAKAHLTRPLSLSLSALPSSITCRGLLFSVT